MSWYAHALWVNCLVGQLVVLMGLTENGELHKFLRGLRSKSGAAYAWFVAISALSALCLLWLLVVPLVWLTEKKQ